MRIGKEIIDSSKFGKFDEDCFERGFIGLNESADVVCTCLENDGGGKRGIIPLDEMSIKMVKDLAGVFLPAGFAG